MRLLRRWLWVFALWVFPIVGCNPVTTPPETALLRLVVNGGNTVDGEWVPHGPLEGAELCDTDTGKCELSDARGKVEIELPVGSEVSYTLE